MARTAITDKSTRARKLAAAARAIKQARGTLVSSRRSYSLPRPRFWGVGAGTRARELKTIDSGTVAYGAVGGGAVNCTLLNGVATGTDYTNRIGRTITMSSILIRFKFYVNTSTNTGDTIRIMLIYDTQTNGAIPTSTDVLQTANYMEPVNLNNRDRFLVLRDKFIGMPAAVITPPLVAGSPREVPVKMYLKLNKDTIYGGTTSGIASIQSGALYLLMISGGGFCNAVYNSRVRFYDS